MGLGDIGNYLDENWHGGQMDGDYFEHPEIPVEENAAPERTDAAPQVWNWMRAMTRELMRGRHKAEILAKYGPVVDRFGVRDEVSAFLDRNDGVLGWFLVDVANFDEKFGYGDIPEEMRACNLYALNAVELREVISRRLVSDGDGTMDGFLGSEDGVDEEITYVDECTGLPCIDGWDGESDDDDERLAGIANLFLGRKWMSLSEKERFDGMEGKLPYLVSVVKRHFSPKSSSDGKFSDDVSDYGVKGQELEADSQRAFKDAEVENIHETAIDDVGYVAMPEKYDIEDEKRKSDYVEDVQVGAKLVPVEVGRELSPSDFRDDVDVDEVVSDRELDGLAVTRESDLSDIETDVPDYGEFGDYLSELGDRDYEDDFEIDESAEDLVIDDVDEMRDDEFDFADLGEGDVDLDEMMEEESDKNVADVDDVPEEVEISNKYDWSW